RPTVAVVVEGTFRYRTDAGGSLLYPGAFLLGNSGSCFMCSHEHGVGDRCIGFGFAPALFDEIAATAARARKFRFPAAMLPALPEVTVPVVDIEALSNSTSQLAAEEVALRVAETVIGTVSGGAARGGGSPGDERRIGRTLRYLEENAAQ